MLKWINKKRNTKGFTLIELIVVIAILGILAAIAIPRFTGVRKDANLSSIHANLVSLQKAAEMVAAQENKAITEVTKAEALLVLDVTDITGPGSVTYDMSSGDATATVETVGNPPLPDDPTLKYSKIPK